MTTNTDNNVAAADEQCKTIGKAELKLAEVVHYPSNKLHGSVLLNSCPSSGSQKDPTVIGSIDFWFKLHTAAASRIQEWLDHRQEVQRVLEATNKENEARTSVAEVQLLKGEQRAIDLPDNQEKLVGRQRKLPIQPELVQAPRLAKKVETKEVAEPQVEVEKGIKIEPDNEAQPENEPLENSNVVPNPANLESEKKQAPNEAKIRKGPTKKLVKTKGSAVDDENKDETIEIKSVVKESDKKWQAKLPKLKSNKPLPTLPSSSSPLSKESDTKENEKLKDEADSKTKLETDESSASTNAESKSKVDVEKKPVPKPRGPI